MTVQQLLPFNSPAITPLSERSLNARRVTHEQSRERVHLAPLVVFSAVLLTLGLHLLASPTPPFCGPMNCSVGRCQSRHRGRRCGARCIAAATGCSRHSTPARGAGATSSAARNSRSDCPGCSSPAPARCACFGSSEALGRLGRLRRVAVCARERHARAQAGQFRGYGCCSLYRARSLRPRRLAPDVLAPEKPALGQRRRSIRPLPDPSFRGALQRRARCRRIVANAVHGGPAAGTRASGGAISRVLPGCSRGCPVSGKSPGSTTRGAGCPRFIE